MLRLVHPAPQGKVSARPKGRKSPALFPSHEERLRIHAAIRNLARAYGGFDVLGAVMGIPVKTLLRAKRQASYAIAILAARAAGIPVEQILSGKPHEVGACAVCGRKGAR